MPAASLHFESSSVEFKSLAAAGTLPGAIPLFAAAKNGPGAGLLVSSGDGKTLAFRAPGSATIGAAVDCSAGGTFILYDGDDPDKFLRIEVFPDDLLSSAIEKTVYLEDVYSSVAGGPDLSAPQADAGNVVSYSFQLKNYGSTTLTAIKTWIDAATPDLEISANGSSYSSPTSEGTALSLADLTAGNSLTLYLRRTIAADSPSAAEVLNLLHFSFVESAATYHADCRGKYRVFNAAGYNFFRSNSAPPVESDTPFDFAASLPHTPADTFADGTWYLSLSAFNGVRNSGFMPLGPHGETFVRIDIVSGVGVYSPPLGPTEWHLEAAAGGQVRIVAMVADSSDLRAHEWAINYTTNGTTPTTDAAAISREIDSAGLAILDYLLPAQADGATVKVRLQTRRNDGTDLSPVWTYSEDSTVLVAVADAVGPGAPRFGEKMSRIGEI